jgi:two-component sensor histidine kinase/ABC-type amino acid transport substrate-binding protein
MTACRPEASRRAGRIRRETTRGLLACAAFLLLGAPALPESIADIQRIKVVCDDNYPPYAFIGSDGKLQGIVPDQWKAWEKATGVAVELRGLPWAEALRAIGRDEADVIDTIFETPARRLHYEFTQPYASIEVPVFIHKSISGIASIRDLKGFKVAVKSGDAAVSELLGRGVSELAPYDSYEAIIDAAQRLEARIFCVDKPPALYLLYKRGIDRDFKIAFVLNKGEFCRAVKKERPELFALVEKGFAALPSPVLESIENKWIGSELARGFDPRVFLAVAAAALALTGVLLFTAWGLRRRIRAATTELREKVALLEKSEARDRASIAEKEVLLKEIHHRVKNNMQIISSLIQLKAGEYLLDEERGLIADIQQRIQSMAQLHELLYRSKDFGSIDAAEYVEAISRELALSYAWPEIGCSAESVSIEIDEALPLGLVAGELLINALKYAYPKPMRGPIRLSLGRDAERIALRVEDEGRGLPPGTDPLTCPSMGFTIVRGLASQLRAELAFGGPPGFWAEMRFRGAREK